MAGLMTGIPLKDAPKFNDALLLLGVLVGCSAALKNIQHALSPKFKESLTALGQAIEEIYDPEKSIVQHVPGAARAIIFHAGHSVGAGVKNTKVNNSDTWDGVLFKAAVNSVVSFIDPLTTPVVNFAYNWAAYIGSTVKDAVSGHLQPNGDTRPSKAAGVLTKDILTGLLAYGAVQGIGKVAGPIVSENQLLRLGLFVIVGSFMTGNIGAVNRWIASVKAMLDQISAADKAALDIKTATISSAADLEKVLNEVESLVKTPGQISSELARQNHALGQIFNNLENTHTLADAPGAAVAQNLMDADRALELLTYGIKDCPGLEFIGADALVNLNALIQQILSHAEPEGGDVLLDAKASAAAIVALSSLEQSIAQHLSDHSAHHDVVQLANEAAERGQEGINVRRESPTMK